MNRRFRFALHWQIFIALFVALCYGLIFSTNYIITEDSVNKISSECDSIVIEISQINKLLLLEGMQFPTQESIEDQINTYYSDKELQIIFPLLITYSYYNPAIKSIKWMGDIFLRGLKMLVIPLIIFSIVSGIANITGGRDLGRLGLKTLVYYILTSLLAIITGLVFVNVLQPGEGFEIGTIYQGMENLNISQKSLGEILTEIVPENIFQSMVENQLLSIIFFSIMIGIFITRLSNRYSTFLNDLFNAGFELFMKITLFFIKLAPLGIFGLVAPIIADQDDIIGLMVKLGLFSLAILLSLFIHSFFTLPLLLKYVGKAKAFKHFTNMSPAILTAFSTASSAATLPLTLTNVEDNSGVSKKIANFTLPIGATVNMDGTAIYICAVVLFIAQATGADIGFKEQFFIVITTLLASIGTAAIPMASLVIMTIILTALNLPVELIALVLPVDRILDMFRTATNVWSDSCGAVIIAKTEGEELNV